MEPNVLLCCDLDRTILPNGTQEESPNARPLLRAFCERPDVTLAYVSGRHKELQRRAIAEYSIPVPGYAIGDVGATIYEVTGDRWEPWDEWSEEIGVDWGDMTHADLQALFSDMSLLRLQEGEKQNAFKLSYYTDTDIEKDALRRDMAGRLSGAGVRAVLVWSVDEAANRGLLDVLPARATKEHAVRFLMERKGFTERQTVFCGDSGNDLPALTSGLQAVLVRNARDDVRRLALEGVGAAGVAHRLYIARGDFLGMNGNYAAGVLEGVSHFFPEKEEWLREAWQRIAEGV